MGAYMNLEHLFLFRLKICSFPVHLFVQQNLFNVRSFILLSTQLRQRGDRNVGHMPIAKG